MRKIILQKQKVLRFCRWSRKAYGAFVSLHREVSIGQVCKSIADAAITKSDHLTIKQTCIATIPSEESCSPGNGSGDATWPSPFSLQENPILAIIFYALSKTTTCHCQGAYCLINKEFYRNVLSRPSKSAETGRFLLYAQSIW